MSATIENVIFSNLVENEEYTRRVIPFLKPEYFTDNSDRLLYELINDYVQKYNRTPSKESLRIDLDSTTKPGVTEDVYKNVSGTIAELAADKNSNMDWLVDQTEKFCQDKAIYIAVRAAIDIIDDAKNIGGRGAIPQLLSNALAVTFDSSIGHDYFDDSENRFKFYHEKSNRVPFDISLLNTITNGGLPNKTLTLLMAGPHVGKSLFMCHMAAANLYDGKNVLYISMEMSEEALAMRIDANLLDIPIGEMGTIPQEMFEKKMARVKGKTRGKLIIKEYPTAGAGAANFRHLLNELRIKKNFKPDIVYIDYLNICMSSRIAKGKVNSYDYMKSVAEELRGLAIEFNIPIVSATQTNRSGFVNSDPGMEDVSESFGLAMTADAMFALIATDELKELNQILVKQLKNRIGDVNLYNKFVIGVDRPRFKLFDVEQTKEDNDDKPVMDKTDFIKKDSNKSKFNVSQFGELT